MTGQKRLDYNPLSATYDRRYGPAGSRMEGIGRVLTQMVEKRKPALALEVGCGTGHWLASLQSLSGKRLGVDLSIGMLRQAQQNQPGSLTCADASHLPMVEESFDLIFVVNAIHHFSAPHDFVFEAYRLLKPGGALAVIGMDPGSGKNQWYLYEYFPGTEQTDRERYPSAGKILDWMIMAGFDRVEWQPVEQVNQTLRGEEVLNDPFLEKHGTSQLAILSDSDYQAGIDRIHHTLAKSREQQEEVCFFVRLTLAMVLGIKLA